MTRSISTRVRISREQILLVISTIEIVCSTLLSLVAILKGLVKTLDAAEDVIAGRKGK